MYPQFHHLGPVLLTAYASANHLLMLKWYCQVYFQTQNLWEERIQMNHAMRFTNVCTCQITGICAII